MTTSRRNQNQISKLLLYDIDVERSLLQVGERHYMRFMVEFMLHIVEITGDFGTI
jgi:hypothetical protein